MRGDRNNEHLNAVNADSKPSPKQLLFGDITDIQTDEDWLYVVALIHMFSRQVVGWRLQSHTQTNLLKDALAMTWWRRRPVPGAIFHSDRGSQYCSHDLQAALGKWEIRSSMGRKGNFWDNSPLKASGMTQNSLRTRAALHYP